MSWEWTNSPWLWAGVLIGLAGLRMLLAKTEWGEFDRLRKRLLETADAFLFALSLVLLIIRPFVVHAFHIPSQSMRPTLEVNDKILVNKFIYRIRPPRRQEIVVFEAPPEALRWSARPDQTTYIKRVIGIPGDLIRIEDGHVYVNGVRLKEPYVKFPDTARTFPDEYLDEWLYNPELGEYVVTRKGKLWVRVPDGYYFVMGDNRGNSSDSRRWGFVAINRFEGKALFRWWPLWRVGLVW